MKILKIKAIVLAIVFAGGISTEILAQELTGRDIIKKVYERPEGDVVSINRYCSFW